jgi:HK97 family phage prohead protease
MGATQYDFSGYVTRYNVPCTDGRTIRNHAFDDCDGLTVPLVWNHNHNEPSKVLGHAVLEKRDDGIYTYATFNDSQAGKNVKLLVEHGDITSLSIYANKLKQMGGDVLHGAIREVSVVLAGANRGAFIDNVVLAHGDDVEELDEAIIFSADEIEIAHSDITDNPETTNSKGETNMYNQSFAHADNTDPEDGKKPVGETKKGDEKDPTIMDVFNTLSDIQKKCVYAIVGEAMSAKEEDEKKSGGNDSMKHNVFDADYEQPSNVISHADQEMILNLAKQTNVGSFRQALQIYAEENSLSHGAIDGDDLNTLFPDYKDVYPGEPETLNDDQSWIAGVISGVHKSPISRVRTRQLDNRNRRNRGKGYVKGNKKSEGTSVALLSRTTDPQTIYVKDKINRDDIVDFTDFDLVNYQWKIMRQALNEELAMAIMVGDGREEGSEDKISETHIRSIWNDDELYTLHKDVDLAEAKKTLQGTNTGANFSDNYVYAEAIIEATLYAREDYKGSGSLTFYCTPHLLNVMLLARDLNGRRIYSSKSDLEAALNVKSIQTVEQFEGLVRTDKELNKHELLGIFVNLSDYQVGSTKGGEITRFDQFDIDFNQQKYLIETRVSGALTRVQSAIVLESPVTEAAG